MGASVAVQVGSPEKLTTPKVAPLDSDADSLLGLMLPSEQSRLTVTEALLSGTKSFSTTKTPMLRE